MTNQFAKSYTILITTAVLFLILLTYLIINIVALTTSNQAYAQTEPITTEINSSHEVITATVISKTTDGLFYTAVNNNDSDDIIIIEGNFVKGDKVVITIYQDEVERVEVLERGTF